MSRTSAILFDARCLQTRLSSTIVQKSRRARDCIKHPLAHSMPIALIIQWHYIYDGTRPQGTALQRSRHWILFCIVLVVEMKRATGDAPIVIHTKSWRHISTFCVFLMCEETNSNMLSYWSMEGQGIVFYRSLIALSTRWYFRLGSFEYFIVSNT